MATKKTPSYSSLALIKQDDISWVIVTHTHSEDGTVLSRETDTPVPYHIAVYDLKKKASRLFTEVK
jgi:hypothetical protein